MTWQKALTKASNSLKAKKRSIKGKKEQHIGSDSVAEKRDERKYKNVPLGDFCGTEAGRNPMSYPVNTWSRIHAAESYARFAKNPAGFIKGN